MNIRCLLTLLCFATLAPVTAPALADGPAAAPAAKAQTPNATYTNPAAVGQKGEWRVSPGANTVMVSGDEVLVRQREPRNTTNYALAIKGLTVPAQGAWKVSFDLRMGELGTTTSGVGLYAGEALIGWVGADNYYKVLGSFFGNDFFTKVDNSLFPLADARWHAFEFRGGEGGKVSIWRDGKQVASADRDLRPDAIKVGQVHLLFRETPPSLQQSELWVRNIRVKTAGQ